MKANCSVIILIPNKEFCLVLRLEVVLNHFFLTLGIRDLYWVYFKLSPNLNSVYHCPFYQFGLSHSHLSHIKL